MYSKRDIELFKENITNIRDDSIKKSFEVLHPTGTESKEITNIICNYIKENKLKIYGGQGQNLALKSIDPDNVFYHDSDIDIHDYDIYSFEPIKHIQDLCNLLYDSGFTSVKCIEAQHRDTFTIKVDNTTYADITYVPTKVYNYMRVINYDGYVIIDPMFMIIDYLRMFTDPLKTSSFRWDKQFERYIKIQETFPIQKNTEPINTKVICLSDDSLPKDIHKIMRNYIKKSDTLITTGIDVFNKYIKLSKNLPKYIKKLPLYYIEMVSGDYENDVKGLMEELLLKIPNSEIGCKEKYPFFQYTDESTEIYVNHILVAHIFKNNNKCIPYIIINNRKYGTFQFNLMWMLVTSFYKRIYGHNDYNMKLITKNERRNNADIELEYKKLAYQLIKIRELYFKEHGKNFLSKSPFQDFIIDCSGKPIGDNEYKIKGIQNYRGYKYELPKHRKNPPEKNFVNTSGNYIRNSKNCRMQID